MSFFIGNDGKKYLYISYFVFLLSLFYVFVNFGLGFYQIFLINVLGIYIFARIQFLDLSNPEYYEQEFSQNVYYGLIPFLIIFISNILS